MGKQAPLVFDSGLAVREFVYNEGKGTKWHQTLRFPRRSVGWICIQKGDEITGQLQVDPGLTDGYSLALKTEYFSIYRRAD